MPTLVYAEWTLVSAPPTFTLAPAGLLLGVATGCPDVPEDGCTVVCTVVYDDGVATSSSPFSAADFGCAGWADGIRRAADVQQVLCYEDAATIAERTVFEDTLDVNDGQDLIIEVGRTEEGPIVGDLNINAGGRVIVSGAGPTQSVIDGNANVHSGAVVIRNVTFTGDVTIDVDPPAATLSHCRVFGNVTVNAPQASVVDCAIFGDLDLNASAAYLVDVALEGEINVNDLDTACDNVRTWADTDGDDLVTPSETGNPIDCGAGT